VRELRAQLESPATSDDDALGIRLDLATALFGQWRIVEAVRELEALLGEPGLSEERRAYALSVLADSLPLVGRLKDALAAGEAVLASRAASQEAIVFARIAMRVVHFFEGRYEQAVAEAREIVRLAAGGTAVTRGEAMIDMGGMLYHADNFDEAEQWLTRDEGYDRHQRQEAAEVLAALNLMRGRWNTVLDGIAPPGGEDPDLPDRSRVSRPSFRAHALIHLDRVEQARRELSAPTPHQAPPITLVALALVAEADGEIAAVGACAERSAALATEPVHLPQLRMWGPEIVRLALSAGDTATAQRMTRFLEGASAVTKLPSVHAAAEEARGMVERDPDLLASAVRGFAAGPRALAHAQAIEALGLVERDLGDTEAALASLRSALAAWERLVATRDARRVMQTMADLGVRTRPIRRTTATIGWNALSPTEATVATLIAEGFSNAEIAERLVISRRTAESHVAHVLAKLEVPSRAGVARVLAARRGGGS
jgi:DNA-binding NarL/FixJ family response regulator